MSRRRPARFVSPDEIAVERHRSENDRPGDSTTYIVRDGAGRELGRVSSSRSDSYASDTTGSPYRYGYRGSPRSWSASVKESIEWVGRLRLTIGRRPRCSTRREAVEWLVSNHNRVELYRSLGCPANIEDWSPADLASTPKA
jgi:hypothetical protein